MIKYLKYELKKHLWLFLLLSVIVAVPYVTHVSTMTMTRVLEYDYQYREIVYSPNLTFVVTELIFLTFLMPIFMYSFKMNKRGVDAYYALPLTKERLYFVKTLVGLFLVIVPFTIGYWMGFFALLVRPNNPYFMGWYIPAYFGFVAYAVLLFGFNAFVYTRANRVWDGIVFMIAYAFVGVLVLSYIELVAHHSIWGYVDETFMTFGGMVSFARCMESLIRYSSNSVLWNAWMFVVPAVYGAVGYFLLFYMLRYEKGENAEQISNSWFGYRLLIPLYTALVMGCNSYGGLFDLVLIIIAEIVVTIVYRNKFRFSWKYWLMIVGSIILGMFLGLLTEWTLPPPVNSPDQMFMTLGYLL